MLMLCASRRISASLRLRNAWSTWSRYLGSLRRKISLINKIWVVVDIELGIARKVLYTKFVFDADVEIPHSGYGQPIVNFSFKLYSELI